MIVSAVTLWPQISTDLTRRSTRGDINCQKAFGMITALLGFVASLASLQTYKQNCYDEVESVEVCRGDFCVDMAFELGPGYLALAFATFFKVIDFVIHALTPTPTYRHFSDTNTHFDPSTAESAAATTSHSVEMTAPVAGAGIKGDQVL